VAERKEVNMEKILFKSLRTVSTALTVLFVFLSYGGDPVAWAASVGMSVASLAILLVPIDV
jgi:small-conductance mechanosensitive channel